MTATSAAGAPVATGRGLLKPRRIPLVAKLLYTAFLCVLVPYYWVAYTPWNFLYFCDVALLLTLVGLWKEDALLISMSAVGITLPQMLWVADFLLRFVGGIHITGMTGYMFDPAIPLFVRGLSTFHGWLPFLLLWLVARMGYDRRALKMQAALGIAVLLVSYFLAPGPPPPAEHPSAAVNINYVHGLNDKQAQTWMPPLLWLLLLGAVMMVLYVVTHFGLKKIFRQPAPTSV